MFFKQVARDRWTTRSHSQKRQKTKRQRKKHAHQVAHSNDPYRRASPRERDSHFSKTFTKKLFENSFFKTLQWAVPTCGTMNFASETRTLATSLAPTSNATAPSPPNLYVGPPRPVPQITMLSNCCTSKLRSSLHSAHALHFETRWLRNASTLQFGGGGAAAAPRSARRCRPRAHRMPRTYAHAHYSFNIVAWGRGAVAQLLLGSTTPRRRRRRGAAAAPAING